MESTLLTRTDDNSPAGLTLKPLPGIVGRNSRVNNTRRGWQKVMVISNLVDGPVSIFFVQNTKSEHCLLCTSQLCEKC